MKRLGALRRLTLADQSTWKLRPRASTASLDKVLKRFYGGAQVLDALSRGWAHRPLPSGRRFVFPLHVDR